MRWLASALSVFVFVAYLPGCDAPSDDEPAAEMMGVGGKADDAALSEADIDLIGALESECGTHADAERWADAMMYEDRSIFVIPLPGQKGYVIIRDEAHPMGGSPCVPSPPAGVPVQHYNIEVQICDVPGPRCSGRAIYNLHMAVWTDASGTCYALWENLLSGPRCLAADCLDGASFDEVWDIVKMAARAAFDTIEEALQIILESVYNMHPTLAAVLAFSIAALIIVLIAIPPTGVPG